MLDSVSAADYIKSGVALGSYEVLAACGSGRTDLQASLWPPEIGDGMCVTITFGEGQSAGTSYPRSPCYWLAEASWPAEASQAPYSGLGDQQLNMTPLRCMSWTTADE